MIVLGFETSCDDTAIGIVRNGTDVLANVRHTQQEHDVYGGVVPELAARLHNDAWQNVLSEAFEVSDLTWDDVDVIAVTQGPGLQSALLNGTSIASYLSFLYQKPLIPVHHVKGHVFSCLLERDRTQDIVLPALVLTVSGGHSSMYIWNQDDSVQEVGKTIDDAAGEAFDKVAKMLGLGYPGGPIVSTYAKEGDRSVYDLPYVYLEKTSLDFSFSGIKAAVRRLIKTHHPELLDPGCVVTDEIETFRKNICASFEYIMAKIFEVKVQRVFDRYSDVQQLHFVGGVSANTYIRERLTALCERNKKAFLVPKQFGYCTDNGAMIAGLAYWEYKNNPDIAQVQFIEAKSRLCV